MTNTTVSAPTNALQDIEDDHFMMQVHQAAQIMNRPEFNGKLSDAIQLVLAKAVSLHEDGTATVKSGSHTYEIAPECTCQDSQQCSIYCKHYLAVQLLKRTYERLGGHATGNGCVFR